MITNITKKVFFNKYRTKKLIYSSHIGQVFEGINIKGNEPVAMKFSKIGSKYNTLESEAYFLVYLKGFGIPKILSFGKSGNYNLLIEELLGSSLLKIFYLRKNRKLNALIKDVCMIGLQVLKRLEYIHYKNIIHRDIKPENFLIGRTNPKIIYLIDFGLAHKYRSSRTGKHIKFKHIKLIFGSYRYMSINANQGNELSRRDDLISFCYMIIFLLKSDLPWMKLEKLKLKKPILNREILKIKKSISINELCKGLPEEFELLIKYINQLEFEQDPNYNYLKGLFTLVLQKNEMKVDYLFSWIKTQKGSNENIDDNLVTAHRKSKGSIQKRLYNKIKDSLDRAKSQEQNIKLNFGLEKDTINRNKSLLNLKIYFKKKINTKKEFFNIKKIKTNDISNKILIEKNLNAVNYNKDKNSNEIQKKKGIKNIPKVKNQNVSISFPLNQIYYFKKNNYKSNYFNRERFGINKTNNNFNILNINNKYNFLNDNILKNYSNTNVFESNEFHIKSSNSYRTFEEREKLKLMSIKRSVDDQINFNSFNSNNSFYMNKININNNLNIMKNSINNIKPLKNNRNSFKSFNIIKNRYENSFSNLKNNNQFQKRDKTIDINNQMVNLQKSWTKEYNKFYNNKNNFFLSDREFE